MRRRWALAALALAVAVALAGAPSRVRPAQAQVEPPEQPPCTSDYCLGDGEEIPGEGPDPGPPGEGGGPRCTSVPFGGSGVGDGVGLGLPNNPGPKPSPDSVLMYVECEGEATGRVVWWTPGEPQPLSPADLGQIVRARLEGNLPPPEVTSSPPVGVAAILGFPSFVSVDNWSGTVTDRECDPTVPTFCVGVVAEPSSLAWLPGEPGVEAVPCAGSGTRFDPAGGTPDEQAAVDGACAHAYRLRTGVLDRPDVWPGAVFVRWQLTYTSPAGDGTLPDVVKSTALERAVDEVQTVVESAG